MSGKTNNNRKVVYVCLALFAVMVFLVSRAHSLESYRIKGGWRVALPADSIVYQTTVHNRSNEQIEYRTVGMHERYQINVYGKSQVPNCPAYIEITREGNDAIYAIRKADKSVALPEEVESCVTNIIETLNQDHLARKREAKQAADIEKKLTKATMSKQEREFARQQALKSAWETKTPESEQ